MNTKYSYLDFLTKPLVIDSEEDLTVNLDKVEIPIIQRDYAQGRSKLSDGNMNETGKRFIGAIFEQLCDNTDMEMDFVYGSVNSYKVQDRKNKNRQIERHSFLPLDGQQRLTTLFLLYWYIGVRELGDGLDDLLGKLQKFTYETRTSSRRFCQELCKIENVNYSVSKAISKEIEDSPWFYKSYRKDPTIKAMLNMLDRIQTLYNEWFHTEFDILLEKGPVNFTYLKDDKYTSINGKVADLIPEEFDKKKDGIAIFDMSSEETMYIQRASIVTAQGLSLYCRLDNLKFYPFPLNEFNLTEDIYIKMNARGKQLTDYENFKADLIAWMKSDKNPEKAKFNEIPEGKSLPYYLHFSQKLDHDWTRMFWIVSREFNSEARDEKKRLIYSHGKLVDPLFMRFFKRYFHIRRILTAGMRYSDLEKDSIVNYFYGTKGTDESVIYDSNDFDSAYNPLLCFDTISSIETIFERMSGTTQEGRNILSIVGECMSPAWNSEKNLHFYNAKIEQTGRMAFCACLEYFSRNDFNEARFREWMRVIWNFIDEPSLRTVEGMIGAFNFIHDIAPYSNDILAYLCDASKEFRPTAYKEQFSEEETKAYLICKGKSTNELAWKDEILEAELFPLFKGKIIPLLVEGNDTDITMFHKRRLTVECIFKENSFKDRSEDFLWVRALLSYCDSIKADSQISLENGNQDNWRTMVSKQFMPAFRKLIEDTLEVDDYQTFMETVCANYSPSNEMQWAKALVSWKTEDNHTLLGNYSDNRRLLCYEGAYYLLKSVQWSEGVICLSNKRNALIKEILTNGLSSYRWDINKYEGNIRGEYFRGHNITLEREVTWGETKYVFKYILKSGKAEVGLRADETKRRLFAEYLSSQDKKPDDKNITWIAMKSYELSDNINPQELCETIEKEVFSANNPKSIVSVLGRFIPAVTSK